MVSTRYRGNLCCSGCVVGVSGSVWVFLSQVAGIEWREG